MRRVFVDPNRVVLYLTAVGTIAAVVAVIPLFFSWFSDRPELHIDDNLTGRTYVAADFDDPAAEQEILVTNRGEKPASVNAVTLVFPERRIDLADEASRRQLFRTYGFDAHALRWDQLERDETIRKDGSFRLFFIKLASFKPELQDREQRADELNRLVINLRRMTADIRYNERYHVYWPTNDGRPLDERQGVIWGFALIVFVSLAGLFACYRTWPRAPA